MTRIGDHLLRVWEALPLLTNRLRISIHGIWHGCLERSSNPIARNKSSKNGKWSDRLPERRRETSVPSLKAFDHPIDTTVLLLLRPPATLNCAAIFFRARLSFAAFHLRLPPTRAGRWATGEGGGQPLFGRITSTTVGLRRHTECPRVNACK